MGKPDYTSWTREQLLKELLKHKKQKKYGLVWEDKPEQVATLCRENLPVLTEVKNKEMRFGAGPTNILIEGDNYHALSVLNYTHKGKIDVIYIDPPYNTGNKDFKYNDHFVDQEDSYRHSKWLSFMEKRLRLAKNLLKDTGVIFISIDDNEQAQLKMLCDEVFGELNNVQNLVWHSKYTVSNDAKHFSKQHEYVLCYSKNIDLVSINLFERSEEANERYSNPDNDSRGPWKPTPIYAKSGTEKSIYTFTFKNGIKWKPQNGSYPRYSKNTLKTLDEDNRIWFGKSGITSPSKKTFLSEVTQGIKPGSILHYSNFGHTHSANEELSKLLGKGEFSNPKPSLLVKKLVKLAETGKNSIILDFFAGSGTTGHAVMDLNKEDGGKRAFILCTNNENNICTDVCYPRVKKVMQNLYGGPQKKLTADGTTMRYFKTAFVPADQTDTNKRKLVQQSTEMLCLKEGCFDFVTKGADYQIFTDGKKKLAIIYDDEGIDAFKSYIKKIKEKHVVYVFSLDASAREEEFEDVEQFVQLRPIPEAILAIYRRIFNAAA